MSHSHKSMLAMRIRFGIFGGPLCAYTPSLLLKCALKSQTLAQRPQTIQKCLTICFFFFFVFILLIFSACNPQTSASIHRCWIIPSFSWIRVRALAFVLSRTMRSNHYQIIFSNRNFASFFWYAFESDNKNNISTRTTGCDHAFYFLSIQ